jgi:hypothetical protein
MTGDGYLFGRVDIHKRKKLPHWDAEAGIQFVTLHLNADREFERWRAVIVGEVIDRGRPGRYDLLAWCVMPDHLHVILIPGATLATIVRGWKTVSARRLGGGTWWQRDYFDRLIRDEEELSQTIEYVMNNPEAAGLVDWDVRRMYPEVIARCL